MNFFILPVSGFSMNQYTGLKYSMISSAFRSKGNPISYMSACSIARVAGLPPWHFSFLPRDRHLRLENVWHGGLAQITWKSPGL